MKVNENEILIEAKGLTKSYSGILALDNVSIHLKKAERLGIIGANGSGKTTLLNGLCQYINVDYGEIKINGIPVKKSFPVNFNSENGLYRSFQHVRNWENMTVYENILIAGNHSWRETFWNSMVRRKKVLKVEKELWKQAAILFEYFGLKDLVVKENKKVTDLSIGEQKVIELVRIFISNPKVLLLDEPSVGLNGHLNSVLSEHLKELKNRGVGILFVTHDMEFLRNNADHVYFMHQGKIIYDGSANEVLKNEIVINSYLGDVKN